MSPKSAPATEHHRVKVVRRTATPTGVAPLLVEQVGARTDILRLPRPASTISTQALVAVLVLWGLSRSR